MRNPYDATAWIAYSLRIRCFSLLSWSKGDLAPRSYEIASKWKGEELAIGVRKTLTGQHPPLSPTAKENDNIGKLIAYIGSLEKQKHRRKGQPFF